MPDQAILPTVIGRSQATQMPKQLAQGTNQTYPECVLVVESLWFLDHELVRTLLYHSG